MEFIPRLFSAPAGSFFLLGPRGTGKSWWTRRAFPDALVVDLLDPATERRLLARPETLVALAEGMERAGTVIIDEIQKAPALLDVVHLLIERRQGWRFVLTGSSARKLRRGGVNLLAGRAANAAFFPFLAAELGDRFVLEDALELGLIPGILAAPEPRRALAAYAALYLREEVQAEGLVRKVGDFARFLEAISFSHGAQLNVANVARECEVQRRTAAGYVEILEDLLLAERLPPFTKRARRALAAHPKFYFFDAGVYRSLRPAGPLDRPEEVAGAALEGLVWQHLRAWRDWGAPARRELAFWRTRRGTEVDFVIQSEQELIGIEVKNAARVRESYLAPLATFMTDYPEARTAVLYRGTERLKERGVLCVAVDEFLRRLRPDQPVSAALGMAPPP
jgi:uncharacterized protein